MKTISGASLLKTVFLGGLAISSLLSGSLPSNAEVGVAAAVNIDAKGRPPGAAPRVVTLGSNVVFNEEITTDKAGLVQILLLDGTTFTVGPNSKLTIDEFVFDPNTGDAKVVASLTQGVFRFVGARTSQTEGGATVKTPVGTIGIRGGIANFSCDAGECKASLVAGKSLTIVDGDGTKRIVYETGYTAVISKDPSGGTTTTVRRSTKDETGLIQKQLSSKPGQNGGNTGEPPSDEQAEQVAGTNSGLPPTMDVPGSTKPVQSSEPDQVEKVAGIDGKTQDDLDNEIEEEQSNNPPPPSPNARVLTAPTVYNAFFGESYSNTGVRGLVGSTEQNDQTFVLTPAGGRLISSNGAINLPDYSGAQGDEGLESLQVTDGQTPFGTVAGTAYAGVGDFVAYMLGVNGDSTQPYYAIYGTPTPETELVSLETGFNIRRYTLTDDPIQSVPVPFFSNELYAGGFVPGTYNSSDLFIIEPGDSSTGEIHTFQSWVSIEGTGASQRSAAFVNTSNVFRNDDGELVMASGRRGSFRDSTTGEATNMRGGISTIAGASGSHFFGPGAEHFIVGTDASIERPDTFFDGHNGPALYDPNGVGYFEDGHFATHHVAELVETSPLTGLTRSYGLSGPEQFQGFMAGMGESSVGGSNDPYLLLNNNGPNLTVTFNAVDSSFAAQGTVYDSYNTDDVVQRMLLTFGHSGETFGQSAYVDDTYYGAINNEDSVNNALTNDNDQTLAQTPSQSAGSYIVSGRSNPIDGYQHLPDCSECNFIQWGWWGTRLSTGPEDERRDDYVHMGTWVAGAISDAENLPFSGSAYYNGVALGTVTRDQGGGETATFIASGSFTMQYDFAAREGEAWINNFDGMTFESGQGGIADVVGSQALFGGSISGPGDVTGQINGAFVTGQSLDPVYVPNAAAGVIGDFSFSGIGVSGAGTFAAPGTCCGT